MPGQAPVPTVQRADHEQLDPHSHTRLIFMSYASLPVPVRPMISKSLSLSTIDGAGSGEEID